MPLTASTTKWQEIIAAIGMFGLGFVVVAGVIHLGIRNPLYLHADMRSEKLLLLQKWSGKAYSASFGSSHMHNGFDPRTFDQEMAGTPEQTHTINLAIAGGSQSEQRATALEFLRHIQPISQAQGSPGDRACMVILELGAGANFTGNHLIHPRAINVYDWQTARFVTHLTSPKMSSMQRSGRSVYAMAAMALHYMNVGMLSNLIFPTPMNDEMLADETINDRRGIYVLTPATPALQAIASMIAKAPKQAAVKEGVIVPGNLELADELEDASPVRNLQMVYVVMPKITDLQSWIKYPDSIATTHGLVPVVNLANPMLYPQIYQPKFWHDDAHLNEAGAQMATGFLAKTLKNWYISHGQPATCGR